MAHLFSYGTLQQPGVQMASFGRLLKGTPDTLPGWRREMVEITDVAVFAQSGELTMPKDREATELFSSALYCVAMTRVRVTVPPAGPNEAMTTGNVALSAAVPVPEEKAVAGSATLNDPNSKSSVQLSTR